MMACAVTIKDQPWETRRCAATSQSHLQQQIWFHISHKISWNQIFSLGNEKIKQRTWGMRTWGKYSFVDRYKWQQQYGCHTYLGLQQVRYDNSPLFLNHILWGLPPVTLHSDKCNVGYRNPLEKSPFWEDYSMRICRSALHVIKWDLILKANGVKGFCSILVKVTSWHATILQNR